MNNDRNRKRQRQYRGPRARKRTVPREGADVVHIFGKGIGVACACCIEEQVADGRMERIRDDAHFEAVILDYEARGINPLPPGIERPDFGRSPGAVH